MKKYMFAVWAILILCASVFADETRTRAQYFAAKWMPPITDETSCGWAYSLEYGHIFKSGFFWGIEVGLGVEYKDVYRCYDNSYMYCSYEDKWSITGGYLFNLGHTLELPNQFHLAYGGSIGPWIALHMRETNYDDYQKGTASMGGPFVRLRWRFVEVMYRGLLGVGLTYEDNYYWDDYEQKIGFGYISQLMLGIHFSW